MIRILIVLFLALVNSVFAQQYSFLEYSTSEGLPQSQVTSMLQDKDGYLWVGTLGGLSRFNGADFQNFTVSDGLVNNKITILTEVKNQLWVGHHGGISLLEKNSFKSWSLPPETKTVHVTGIVDYNNQIVLCTNGAGIYKLSNEKLVGLAKKEKYLDRIRDMVSIGENYYLATQNGIYFTKDFVTYKILSNTEGFNVSDLEVKNNQLCVTTFQEGLFLFSAKRELIKSISVPFEMSPRKCMIDNNNHIWLAAREGIYRIKPNNPPELIDDSKGLPLNDIEAIYQDKEGNVWLGTSGKGLVSFPGEQFLFYNQKTGMPSDLVININEDKKGNLWVGTYDKGLLKYSDHKQFEVIDDRNPTFWTSALDVNGANWFGSEAGLLEIRNEKKSFWKKEDGLLNDKISVLHKIDRGSMYVGGSEGLMLYENGRFTVLIDNDKKDVGTIRDIEILNQQIFLATDKGFFVIENGIPELLSNMQRTSFCIAKDDKKQLWLGTEQGLYKYKNGILEQFHFSEDPASNFINFVDWQEDLLYIGTNNGLFIIVKESKVEHYVVQDGVVNLETNLNGSFIDKNGDYWFGTASGMVKYSRLREKPKQPRPQLIFKNILLNYQPVNQAELIKDDVLTFTSEKNNLSFEFDGISLSNPQTVRFQYWLKGVEEAWSPSSKNNSIAFTGLSSGEYELHARAVLGMGTYSNEKIIPFNILPPFYFTVWFIAAVVLAIGLLIYLFIRYRILKERQKNEQEKMEYRTRLLGLEQQSLNASMNRHFIFNSLNSIQYFINTQDKLSANKYLSNFAQLIRENLDSASQKGNMVSLSKEIERLKLYLSLESMRFQDRFVYTFELKDVDTESIEVPAMLFQPFVENSIIHGVLPNEDKMGQITIVIWIEASTLFIRISDNGIGISQSMQNKHPSEGDHKSQGMEITAKRIELIKQLSNKAFEITGPVDTLDDNRLINGTTVLLKLPFERLD
ncbi:MAG: ligand-binding sensor domain-containing protein/signal transduction histidine kinase [Psychromonas sp.]|jgi:ligand-binding sensor domain-containing protein/signal transduction histidine kinase